ncbi:unnamed protein product [Mycena citricolor]|uniref:Uncharacterized protein n=1 Tax=Mycena citricolor TaxID=2018698 RepID=A0AAD2Q751_9AGAR|nr:unnamed protein product [Mycena citricolor]
MEGPYAQPPVPRLRIPRQPLSAVADRLTFHEDSDSNAEAGPSSYLSNGHSQHTSGPSSDDTQPTPRPRSGNSVSGSGSPPPLDAASRLRALISRMPNSDSPASSSKSPPAARPASPSEFESDFEPPRFSPTPSVGPKESLKDLFSRVLEDTPVKRGTRPRRSSASEVEDSPRLLDRSKAKGKRKSLSDEETDKVNRSSEFSFKSSQATTFDNLRERLTSSHTWKSQATTSGSHEAVNASVNTTTGTETFLRDLDTSRPAHPVFTSTPPHSMELSADSKYQTNLMDHDSEMQNMMKDLDSFDGDAASRPISFPTSREQPTTVKRPHSLHLDTPPTLRKKHSQADIQNSRTRTLSASLTRDSPSHIHEMEREWNKPHAKSSPRPERHLSLGSTTNGHVRERTVSSGSALSDSGSSRGTSIHSHSDYKERMTQLERERNTEREHAWNRPAGARPTSSLSVHSPVHSPSERNRKLSQPTRPASSLSAHSASHSPIERTRKLSQPTRPVSSLSARKPFSRHDSASSTASSHGGSDAEDREAKHEIEHERERNWGSQTPRWTKQSLKSQHNPSPSQSTSALPHSPSNSTSTSSRPRVTSLTGRAEISFSRTTSAVGSSASKAGINSPAIASHRLSIPSSPSPSPGQRPASDRKPVSHIPIRKPAFAEQSSPHRDAQFLAPTPLNVESSEEVTEEERTPTLQTIRIPFEEPVSVAPESPPEDVLFQKALSIATPASPPIERPVTPVLEAPQITISSYLSTPPRRPSLSKSAAEFQTPSPPRDLPDLPDPPSTDDDTTTAAPSTITPAAMTPMRRLDVTASKTPRPPGAWANTPIPSRNDLDAESSDGPYENGLATPVASLSRALPAQTPRPPGAWMPTPRKSILKVRFDPKPSELELSATEESLAETGLATPSDDEETQPPSPKKTTRIRHVDEYGNVRVDDSPPRSRSPIRIVDAMGQPVQEESVAEAEPATQSKSAVIRMVQDGVSDLARELDAISLSFDSNRVPDKRIGELETTSQLSRAARQSIQSHRFEELRANMVRTTEAPKPAPSASRFKVWSLVILSQLFFVYLLYRYRRNKLHEMFLSTYYDPFYPHLHLNGIKSDHLLTPTTAPSVTSLLFTLRHEGLVAFFRHLSEVYTFDWRADVWADESIHWPPT